MGIPPSSFPWAGAEFSLRCHSSCASPEQAGVLRLLTDPHPKRQLPGREPTTLHHPRPLPWLASAAKVSGPQGTELLTREDSGCRGELVCNKQSRPSPGQNGQARCVYRLNRKATHLVQLVFFFSRYL